MSPYWIVTIIICAIAALYLFLIAPGRRPSAMDDFRVRWIAHRGLWNDTRPENSLIAFKAAVEKGYGIETDVRLSADGCLFLFHDDSLRRMTGDERKTESLTLTELKALRLQGTDERIPTLDQLLETVQGKVPLIIEIKPSARLTECCRLLDERMKRYGGSFMVESFDPRAVRWFMKHSPGTVRGQLCGKMPGKAARRKPLTAFVMASLTLNAAGRPHFIALQHETDNLSTRLVRLFGPCMVAWTVRDPGRLEALRDRFDFQIFEGFEPES